MTEADDRCTRCVLSSAVPGIVVRDGVCNLCAAAGNGRAAEDRRALLATDMRRMIDERRGQAEYDCVVAFSGGKDSSYTLLMLVREMGLRCLAVTVDNGFISDRAMENCRAVTGALGVDFLLYAPAFAFMKDMYVRSMTDDDLHVRSAIRRASGICNSCINLINTYMLKTAARHGIPVVAGGYVGGQVPQDAAAIRVRPARSSPQQRAAVERKVAAFGPAAARHFDVGTLADAADPEILVVNPMVTVAVTEDDIVDALVPLGWRRTADTGRHSSNCKLNDLGIAMHHRRHRFHPYALEISEQIRAGLMTRDEGLRRVSEIPALDDMGAQIEKLGLEPGALR